MIAAAALTENKQIFCVSLRLSLVRSERHLSIFRRAPQLRVQVVIVLLKITGPMSESRATDRSTSQRDTVNIVTGRE